MSFSDNMTGNNMVMPVSPMMGGYGNNGFLGGDMAWWLIILLLFANNGWGNGFGGNAGMPFMMNTQNDVQRGFDQNAIMSGINGINTALANAEVSRCNSQANILQTLNNNVAAQTAAMNSLGMSLQNCCCENRAGVADLKYTVATEACADRNALSQALANVVAQNNANTQAILDKMCQQELDALKTQNANLQTQLNMANLAASQTAQTAQILRDNAAQTVALEQYLNPAPVPAYVVQNPSCCNQMFNGYGCGCGN